MNTSTKESIILNPILIKKDFPIFNQSINGFPLVYLDNGSTTQKPLAVINAMEDYYRHYCASVHRGIYVFSEKATYHYENTRRQVQQWIHAQHAEEIIFTSGTTDSINLVAACFSEKYIKTDDIILISAMEHHANLVPWQRVCEKTGASLKIIPILDNGELDLDQYQTLLNEFNNRIKLISVAHISNVLGTINPIKPMIALAHQYNIPVLVDGAQAAPHQPIDVVDLDCDFYVFSAHKCYGPTGLGILYGQQKWLEAMPPYQTGGQMIRCVSFEKTEYAQPPYKFEAGTPNIAAVIGFSAALQYLTQIGMKQIQEYEHRLLQIGLNALAGIPGLKIIGNPQHRAGVISFVMEAAHPHDIATILDQRGIAIRAGHHCAMPLMNRLNLSATARISFGIYNSEEDIRKLIDGLNQVVKIFS